MALTYLTEWEQFVLKEDLIPGSEEYETCRSAWNTVLEEVCAYFGELEGTDYDGFDKFYAKKDLGDDMSKKKRKQECKSCGKDFSIDRSVSIVYCESEHVRPQGTPSLMGHEITKVGGEPKPHLDVSCNICGFTWLEDCYDIK